MMDSDSPENWLFTEGGVYVGGASHGSDQDVCRGADGADEDVENHHMDFVLRNSELHCSGVASQASSLGGGDYQKKNEVISVLHTCLSRSDITN